MQRLLLLGGLFFLLSIYATGQTKLDYSGNWTLSKEKSTLGSAMPIQSRTIKVTQTEKQITIDTTTIWEQSVNGRPAAAGGGNGTSVYPLDGKEMTVERDSFRGKTLSKINGEFLSDGKLSLNSSGKGLFNNVEGISLSKQIWELSDNGKTLKITVTNSTPLGERISEMVFTKN